MRTKLRAAAVLAKQSAVPGLSAYDIGEIERVDHPLGHPCQLHHVQTDNLP